jgi:NADH dehydrogenase
MTQNGNRPRVVILGGGFGGAYCAHALAGTLPDGAADVLLLDQNNYFVFYPFLIEAGTGSLAASHAVISIRAFLKNAAFKMGAIRSVDPAAKTVTFRLSDAESDETIPYDQLVIALGSVTRLPDVPGLKQYGFGIKSLADAIALRDRAIRMLERADATSDPDRRKALLHFVVVGGNFTGVEVAGEFQVFLRQVTKRYPNLEPDDCRVTLVEIADRVLPGLDDDLSTYAVAKMRARKIDIRLRSSVREIGSDRVVLADGETLPCSTVVWCAGIAPNPVLADLALPKDEQGWLLCERDLRVRERPNVWAIGDCAVNPDRHGHPYPATAQHATRQAKHLAQNLARTLRGEATTEFDYESRGSLVGLGCRTGVAKVFGIKLSGFAAWFLWRTFYLLKLPGWGRRLRVALDWTMDLMFGRDYVQLGVIGRPESEPAEKRAAEENA